MPYLSGLSGTHILKMGSRPFQAVMPLSFIFKFISLDTPYFLTQSHVEAVPAYEVNISTLRLITFGDFSHLIL
jgi:hypothetical protein